MNQLNGIAKRQRRCNGGKGFRGAARSANLDRAVVEQPAEHALEDRYRFDFGYEHLKSVALDESDLDKNATVRNHQLARSDRDRRRGNNRGGNKEKEPGPIEIAPRGEHGDWDDHDERQDRADDRTAERHPMDGRLMQRTLVRL